MDAVNICNPILSIVTSIGLDHCESLGPTLFDIATDKAHIIKPNIPCIIGPECLELEPFI